MSKRVTKWESDDGDLYDSKAEASEADVMSRVKHNLKSAGFDYKVTEPASSKYRAVLEAIQSAIKSKGKPAKKVHHD